MERLNKWLARAGLASRRAADRLIADGRVTVNGTVVRELGTKVEPDAHVKVDGKLVKPPASAHVYFMLNKPRGMLTTMSDPEGRPTVGDAARGVGRRVYPVGRLDYNSEGLLLLTDDGDLARDLMHPARKVPKTYLIKVRGRVAREAADRLREGVTIEGRRTAPARVRLVQPGANTWLEITITEGRKHQVRHMLLAVGHPVVKLKRIRYGGLELGDLEPGLLRPLTTAEVDRLRRATVRGSRRPRGAPQRGNRR